MNDIPRPKAMFVFFCWGEGHLSWLISHITGGPSHAGVGFEYEDGTEPDIFEALFAKGVRRKPRSALLQWFAANEKRRLEVIRLNKISRPAMWAKRAQAQAYKGTAGYAELQLLAMYLFERWGRRVRESGKNMVCSELVARLIAPEYSWADERSFDEITPAFLREKLKTTNRGDGHG